MVKRTLIVSPDPGLVQQTRRVLEARGADVFSVATAEEASRASAENPPDLVISQVDLPRDSGYELCRQLKGGDHPPRVLLLFSTAEGSVERNVANCGADGAVRRPFLPAEFLQTLDSIVGRGFFGRPRRTDSSAPGPNGIDPLSTGNIQPLQSSGADTQELPLLNVELFDEANPVSVPVDGSVTAHALPVVSVQSDGARGPTVDHSFDGDDGEAIDEVRDPFTSSRTVSALGRDTGSRPAFVGDGPTPKSLQEAARVRRAVETRLDELLEPGGRLAKLLEATVERAVSAAIAAAVPAATAAADRALSESEGD